MLNKCPPYERIGEKVKIEMKKKDLGVQQQRARCVYSFSGFCRASSGAIKKGGLLCIRVVLCRS